MKTSSAWRSAVISEAIRLSAELATAVAAGGGQVAGGVPAATAERAIERAKAIAAWPVSPEAGSPAAGRPDQASPATASTGTASAATVSTGTADPGTAGTGAASQRARTGQGPDAAATSAPTVPLGAAPRPAAPAGLLARTRDWWSGSSVEAAWQALHLASEQLILMLPDEQAKAAVPGAADGHAAQRAMAAQHAESDAHHQQIRGLRNITTVLLVAVLALDVALWAAGVTTGAVVGLGALGGALSVVFALRAGTPPGPYNVLVSQSLLKLVSGSATALMAAKILDFATGVPASTGRDAMYAVVFGFSQQMFTRLVDQRASTLAQVAAPRKALPASATALAA
jgi:hypothetical protein